MGVDYYYCRVCRETYPDSGYNQVYNCEKCGEGLCGECVEKHNDFSKMKYWGCGEAAVWNKEEEILEEFCPLCSPNADTTEDKDERKN